MALSSMTGFARSNGASGPYTFEWELKSVNAKGFDLRLRLPPGWDELEALAREQFCYLTTTGRKSGKGHTIEIWFAMEPGGRTLYMLSGGGDRSDWVRNLQAEPRVTVRLGTEQFTARGRVVEDPEEDARARTLVFDKYQPRYNGELVTWRGRALPVAIDLGTQS